MTTGLQWEHKNKTKILYWEFKIVLMDTRFTMRKPIKKLMRVAMRTKTKKKLKTKPKKTDESGNENKNKNKKLKTKPKKMLMRVGFEPTPFRTRTLIWRLRPTRPSHQMCLRFYYFIHIQINNNPKVILPSWLSSSVHHRPPVSCVRMRGKATSTHQKRDRRGIIRHAQI